MADNSFSVAFSADTSGFDAGVQRAIASLQDLNSQVAAGLAPLQNLTAAIGDMGGNVSKEAAAAAQQIGDNLKASYATAAKSAEDSQALQLGALAAVNRAAQAEYRTRVEEIQAAAKAGQISGDDEISQLRAVAAEKLMTEETYLAQRSAAAAGNAAEETRIWNQSQAAFQQYQQTLVKLAEQSSAQRSKIEQQTARAWEQSFQPIERGFNTMISGMMSGRETLNQAMLRAASQTVQAEISADARMLISKMALWAATETGAISAGTAEKFSSQATSNSILGLLLLRKTTEQTTEASGVAVHGAAETAKTSATVAGNTARTAANNSSDTSFLGQIGETLASWLGLETSKTAATTASAADQTVAQATAAVAGRALDVAAGMSQISVAAAVAAANTFAATSAIPVIGPELAPEAATAAYGETMGWAAGMGGGVALDVGAWDIPGTMAATLHAGEMVVPADFASGLRSSGTLTGDASASGTGGGNITFAPQVSALDGKSVVALFNNPSIMSQFAKNLGRYMALNPSTRGAY